MMSRNNEGLGKERTFTEWCRRVHSYSGAASTASAGIAPEHAKPDSTGTERASFKSLALDLLSNDLTPEQRDGPKYKITIETETGEISVTTKQRSWIKVAYFIFNHGVPFLDCCSYLLGEEWHPTESSEEC